MIFVEIRYLKVVKPVFFQANLYTSPRSVSLEFRRRFLQANLYTVNALATAHSRQHIFR
jgi:hypothetical protein